MGGWLARRLRIAWRLRRHAFLAGFGLVAVALVVGLGRAEGQEAGAEALLQPSMMLALSAAILGTGLSVAALVALAVLPFLRNLMLVIWFVLLVTMAGLGLDGEGSLVEIARLVIVFGLVVLLYVLPLPVPITHRLSRRLAASPEAIRAVLDPWGTCYFDRSVESVEPVAEREGTFRIRYRKRGLDHLAGTLTMLEDTPERLATHLRTDGRAPLDVTVMIALAPEAEDTRVDYAEAVRRAPAMTHVMIWLDRALADVLDDIEDAALGRPRRSRRALEMPG